MHPQHGCHDIRFATWSAVNDHDFCGRQAYIHLITSRGKWLRVSRTKTMLYIFSKPNFVQIAWNGEAPKSQSRVRNLVMDTPLGPLGFIRTRNVG
jgi:hypothetical protein